MADEKENLVKKVCKELNITQKELSEIINVSEDTVSNWSTGKIQTPKWALKLFELLKVEKKYNTIKRFFLDLENK